MNWRLFAGAIITTAATYCVVVAAGEDGFAPGSPLTGVFAHYQAMEECDTTPPEHLVVITSTDLYLVYDHRWWHGARAENRPILLAWQRPGFLLRAHTERGELIEMVIERNRDTGFEIILEETVEATGGRINHARRADRPIFFRCTGDVTKEPWLVAK